jgi:hypothetical protein
MPTDYLTPIVYWPMIEAALGVIAACLPTLRPLFKGWSVEDFLANMKSTFTLRSTTASSTWKSKGSTRSDEESLGSSSGGHLYKPRYVLCYSWGDGGHGWIEHGRDVRLINLGTRISSRRILRLYRLNRLYFIKMRLRRMGLWLERVSIVLMSHCKILGFERRLDVCKNTWVVFLFSVKCERNEIL